MHDTQNRKNLMYTPWIFWSRVARIVRCENMYLNIVLRTLLCGVQCDDVYRAN